MEKNKEIINPNKYFELVVKGVSVDVSNSDGYLKNELRKVRSGPAYVNLVELGKRKVVAKHYPRPSYPKEFNNKFRHRYQGKLMA